MGKMKVLSCQNNKRHEMEKQMLLPFIAPLLPFTAPARERNQAIFLNAWKLPREKTA